MLLAVGLHNVTSAGGKLPYSFLIWTCCADLHCAVRAKIALWYFQSKCQGLQMVYLGFCKGGKIQRCYRRCSLGLQCPAQIPKPKEKFPLDITHMPVSEINPCWNTEPRSKSRKGLNLRNIDRISWMVVISTPANIFAQKTEYNLRINFCSQISRLLASLLLILFQALLHAPQCHEFTQHQDSDECGA